MKEHCATVERIHNVIRHPNADRLDICTPGDSEWRVVVGREQFKDGDLCIYIPIDSVVPPTFIEKYLKGSKIELNTGRIKSARIRGEISQGLVVPIDPGMKEDQDVTELLGITHYEPPPAPWEFVRANAKKLPPKWKKLYRELEQRFLIYTHIENHKNHPNVLQEGEEVIIREKIHGCCWRSSYMSATVVPEFFWEKVKRILSFKRKPTHAFVVGSHRVIWPHNNKTHIFWDAAIKYNMEDICKKQPNLIFFGEVFGSRVQELEYGCKNDERKLALFDIYNCNERRYLNNDEFEAICEKEQLPVAPPLYKGPWKHDLIKLAEGLTTISGNHHREGFVVRPIVERRDHVGRVILKRVSDSYLLSKGKKTDHH